MTGGVLVLLSTIGLFVSSYVLFSAALRGTHLVPLAGLVIALVSAASLVAASFLLRTKSLYWQIPLQTFGLGAIVAGTQTLVLSAVENWHLLLGFRGLAGLFALLLGIASGWLMKYLQAHLLPRQDA